MLKRSLLALCFLLGSSQIYADMKQDEGHQLLVQTSLWTYHYQPDPDHNNQQELINLIWYPSAAYQPALLKNSPYGWVNHAQWFVGAATFKHSYSQRTYYAYVGGRYNLSENHLVEPYIRLTGGLLHGYRGEYQDKVPLNKYETAPVLVPSIGIEIKQVSLELAAFAASGVMLNIGYYFR